MRPPTPRAPAPTVICYQGYLPAALDWLMAHDITVLRVDEACGQPDAPGVATMLSLWRGALRRADPWWRARVEARWAPTGYAAVYRPGLHGYDLLAYTLGPKASMSNAGWPGWWRSAFQAQ